MDRIKQSVSDRVSMKLLDEWRKKIGSTAVLRTLLKLPALVTIFLMGSFFRLVYKLPFVDQDKKRFLKEQKPVIRFKSKYTLMGLIFGSLLLNVFVSAYLASIVRYVLPWLGEMIKQLFSQRTVPFDWNCFSLGHALNLSIWQEAPILTLPIFVVVSIIVVKGHVTNFEQYRDYNNNEHGNDEFLSEKGVKKTYKKVPNRGKSYPGYGGVPVAHFLKANVSGYALKTKMLWHFPKYDKEDPIKKRFFARIGQMLTWAELIACKLTDPAGYYYIEDGTVNTCLVGMTRSGKGETFVNVLIDLLSRAKKKCSMVVADPKGELFQAAFKTLRRRGYNVQVLNFKNMEFSMSYNPLALAIDYARKGYFEKVQEQVNNVAEAIYRKANADQGNGNAKYFEDTSISLFNAIAMALVWRASETKEWETVTLRNMVEFLSQLGSETVLVRPDGSVTEEFEDGVSKKSKITVYFDSLKKINKSKPSKFLVMADNNFRASDFSSEETKGNIYSSMLSGLNLYLGDSIAKLTSKNSIDLRSVGFPRRLSIKVSSLIEGAIGGNAFVNQTAFITIKDKKGTVLVKDSAIVDVAGYLTYAIKPILPRHFQIELRFNHENNTEVAVLDQKLVLVCKKKFMKLGFGKKNNQVDEAGNPILKTVAVTIEEQTEGLHTKTEEIEIVYSEKPTAIFLVLPPNKPEFGVMLSFFIDQLFNVNVDLAGDEDGSVHNRIHFILDEVGNMAKIPKLATKVSIGLGLGMLFEFILQNLEQLTSIYGKEDAETILSNCSIKEYIKSMSQTTAKEFSEAAGKKTIMKRSKSDNPLNEANPNVRSDHMEQPLITHNQLMKLHAGEALIIVGVKAETQSGQKTANHPILAIKKMEFPYRYMFLHKEFDQSTRLSDIPVSSKHRGLELSAIAIDYEEAFDDLMDYANSFSPDSGTIGTGVLKGRRQKIKETMSGFIQHVSDVVEGEAAFQ